MSQLNPQDLLSLAHAARNQQKSLAVTAKILGDQYYMKEDWVEATIYLHIAYINNHPEYVKIKATMGEVCCRLKEWGKAIECFAKVPSDFSHIALVKAQMGLAYYHLKEWSKVVECLEKVPSDFFHIARVKLQMGLAYYNLKEWSKALECLEKVPSDCPNIFIVKWRMGDALMELKQWKEAMECYKLVPDSTPHINIAVLNAKIGEAQKALEAQQLSESAAGPAPGNKRKSDDKDNEGDAGAGPSIKHARGGGDNEEDPVVIKPDPDAPLTSAASIVGAFGTEEFPHNIDEDFDTGNFLVSLSGVPLAEYDGAALM